MRQHGSVLMLLARSTLWKLLGLFLVMAAVEAGLFARSLGQVLGQEMYGLEQVLEGSRLVHKSLVDGEPTLSPFTFPE